MNTKRLLMAFIAIVFTASSALAEIVTGKVNYLTWTFDTSIGLLRIEGTGSMGRFGTTTSGAISTPWYPYTKQITIVEIGNGAINIGSLAFKGCTNLTAITIPNSVTEIENYVFQGCKSLTSINIPSGVKSIGPSAFDGCFFAKDNFINQSSCSSTNYWSAQIADVEQEDGLLIKGNKAYKCRHWATSITIPDGVTDIESDAFTGCSALNSVIIGSNVTNIRYNAFNGSKLHTIKCKAESAPKLANATVFSPQTLAHAPLYVPEGSWYGYAFDDYWYQFANIKEFVEEKEQVAGTKGYTLMDENYQFAVYDKLNDCIRMVEHYQVDEQNFNTSWTMQEIEGKTYLYNLGAEKYVVRGTDGSLSLTTIPTAVDVENVVNGIRINDNTATWNFVKNENIYGVKSLEEDVTGIISVSEDKAKDIGIYNLCGQRVTRNAKGIVIQNGKKILVK